MVYQHTASTLRSKGLAPSKKMGQNFLVHAHTANRIVELAAIDPQETVIEVGVGLGALTVPLAATAHKIIGIEADSGIVRMHQNDRTLPDNVELRHQDILKTDLAALRDETGDLLTIVANLPYSISTPFVFRLIEQHDCIRRVVVMVQKEVAQRLAATPGSKAYGVPSVLLSAVASVTPLLMVKPGEFHPRPKVDSQVIRIDFTPLPERVSRLPEYDRKLFARIVHAGFGQRRKTLLNALQGLHPDLTKTMLANAINDAGLTPSVRAEKLDLEQFITLTQIIFRVLTNLSEKKS